MFLDLLRRYQQQYGIKVFAYVLMPDHVHLLVEMEKPVEGASGQQKTQAQELSDFMRDLNNNYTKYFNGRYLRKGHLFRERFKAAIIEKEPYLLKMTAYIHLNPQRLSLARDAKDYPYSSYQSYLYNEQASDRDIIAFKQAITEIAGLLNNRDYADYVGSFSQEEGDFIHKKLQRGGILGSDDFIRKVKEAVDAYQASGEAQKYEIEDKKNVRLYFTVGSFLLILLAGAGGVFFISINRQRSAPAGSAPAAVEALDPLAAIRYTEWQIQLTPLGGTGESEDTLTFEDSKFFSARMNAVGLPYSNYSVIRQQDGTIVWETIQSDATGSASWRGEIKDGKMTGIFSLQEIGKEAQAFSFASINSRRKK